MRPGVLLEAVAVSAVLLLFATDPCSGNRDAKRLYDFLLHRQGYNNIVRPVYNRTEKINVTLGLKLSQLIDVDEKNQIMTTNVWVIQEWTDPNLTWDPRDYGDVDQIYVPAESIWHPDIVLYNTADGTYEMTKGTRATLAADGRVKWTPPASFKSSCEIDVTFFPFDEQHCTLKFGSWTYDSNEIEIEHVWQRKEAYPDGDKLVLDIGTDLSGFYVSVEWEIMEARAESSFRKYAGSDMDFREWSFEFSLRRKFLFYTVNLIIPLISHAFITVLVFYVPAHSKEKINLCINILLSLTVFFLMLAEIIPPTSIVVPLLGKYLIFTLILVAVSVIITCLTYNVHFRSSATHTMPNFIRKLFLYWLPRLLMMRRPKIENSHDVHLKHIKLRPCGCFGGGSETRNRYEDQNGPRYQFGSKRTRTQAELMSLSRELEDDVQTGLDSDQYCPEVRKAIEGALFIANHLKEEDAFNRTKEDWKYVALVIDRLFLWIYTTVCVVGTVGIICAAPMLYDRRLPLELDSEDS